MRYDTKIEYYGAGDELERGVTAPRFAKRFAARRIPATDLIALRMRILCVGASLHAPRIARLTA